MGGEGGACLAAVGVEWTAKENLCAFAPLEEEKSQGNLLLTW